MRGYRKMRRADVAGFLFLLAAGCTLSLCAFGIAMALAEAIR